MTPNLYLTDEAISWSVTAHCGINSHAQLYCHFPQAFVYTAAVCGIEFILMTL